MVQAKAIRQRHSFVSIAIGNPPVGLLTFLFTIFFAALAIYQLRSPKPVPASAPLTEFSSARAMKHLGIIASEPHPVGSPAQSKVRDYIKDQLTALGLAPEVQTATSVMQTGGECLYKAEGDWRRESGLAVRPLRFGGRKPGGE
jgi:hypothetical protein